MRLSIFIFTLLFAVFVKAQNVDFLETQFQSKEEYGKAITDVSSGDEYFFEGRFKQALPYYLLAQEQNVNNALLNFKIGVCYLREEQFAKAKLYFVKSKTLDPKVDLKVDLAIAHAFRGNKEYEKALVAYKKYLGTISSSNFQEVTLIQNYIDSCNFTILSEAELKPIKNRASHQEAKAVKSVEQAQEISSEVDKEAFQDHQGNKITYKIQISSSKKQSSIKGLKRLYSGRLKITSDKHNGVYKYYIGNFTNKQEALEALSMSGVKGAFLVKFINEQRK